MYLTGLASYNELMAPKMWQAKEKCHTDIPVQNHTCVTFFIEYSTDGILILG